MAAEAGHPCTQPPLLFLPHQRESEAEERIRCFSFRSDQETLEQQLRESAGLGAPSLPLPPCPELLLPWSLCTAFLLPPTAGPASPCHASGLRGTWHIAELQPILIVLWWLRRGVFDTLLSHLVLLASQSRWKLWV